MITNEELIELARAVEVARAARVSIQRELEVATATEEDAAWTFEKALAVACVERQFNESEEYRLIREILARACD